MVLVHCTLSQCAWSLYSYIEFQPLAFKLCSGQKKAMEK
jgi:hypothetical protein